jgi:hypothetical protein
MMVSDHKTWIVQLRKDVAAANKGVKVNALVNQGLAEKLAAANAEIEQLTKALKEYAEPSNWGCSTCSDSNIVCRKHHEDIWIGFPSKGTSFAVEALAGKEDNDG